MKKWIERSKTISELDPVWRERAKKRLVEQTRPAGSLGVLEEVLERLVAIQKKDRPSVRRKRVLIFAADHGVAEEGVSLYPREVTKAMVLNFLTGGATVNALARHLGAEVLVADVGVDADFSGEPQLIHAKIRRATRNMVLEPAMTEPELDQALTIGWDLAVAAKKEGVELLGLGEMGIANTTAASAVIAALSGGSAEAMTGRGTGLGDEALQHKVRVIEKALNLHQKNLTDPFSVLRCVGGYEIAAMTGAILAAANFNLPVVVDGWIVSSSALAAARLNPLVLNYLFFAHRSEERGHRILLEELDVRPLLDLGMRLGEASGAVLAMGILEAAVRIYDEVATFEEAGVANRHE